MAVGRPSSVRPVGRMRAGVPQTFPGWTIALLECVRSRSNGPSAVGAGSAVGTVSPASEGGGQASRARGRRGAGERGVVGGEPGVERAGEPGADPLGAEVVGREDRLVGEAAGPVLG